MVYHNCITSKVTINIKLAYHELNMIGFHMSRVYQCIPFIKVSLLEIDRQRELLSHAGQLAQSSSRAEHRPANQVCAEQQTWQQAIRSVQNAELDVYCNPDPYCSTCPLSFKLIVVANSDQLL